jgi:plastocyanin|tara:strand:+ start:655 stop:1233 length:579 start_codon:yes stop_codon:yes gene_type:complete
VKPAIVASIVCLLLSAVLVSGNLANQDDGEVVVVSVDSTNLRFSPETITLQEGDSVRFFWSGELLAHNAVESNGLFDSGEASRNVDYTYTFNIGENGTYEYVCEPHEELGMIGTIIVEPKPADEQDPEEDPDEGNDAVEAQSEGFTVPHVELVVVIGILLLIYQMVRIRSFGDIKLQKVNDIEEEMDAEILE